MKWERISGCFEEKLELVFDCRSESSNGNVPMCNKQSLSFMFKFNKSQLANETIISNFMLPIVVGVSFVNSFILLKVKFLVVVIVRILKPATGCHVDVWVCLVVVA